MGFLFKISFVGLEPFCKMEGTRDNAGGGARDTVGYERVRACEGRDVSECECACMRVRKRIDI